MVYSMLLIELSTDDFQLVLTASEHSIAASDRFSSFRTTRVMRLFRYPPVSEKYSSDSSLTRCPRDNGTLFLSTYI